MDLHGVLMVQIQTISTLDSIDSACSDANGFLTYVMMVYI